VLVCLLLAAEAFAVVHPLDFDAHLTDEPCKICISVASFGTATVAAISDLVIDSASPTLVVVPVVLSIRPRPTSHFARGPPVAS
jgi:hypothetical protein